MLNTSGDKATERAYTYSKTSLRQWITWSYMLSIVYRLQPDYVIKRGSLNVIKLKTHSLTHYKSLVATLEPSEKLRGLKININRAHSEYSKILFFRFSAFFYFHQNYKSKYKTQPNHFENENFEKIYFLSKNFQISLRNFVPKFLWRFLSSKLASSV